MKILNNFEALQNTFRDHTDFASPKSRSAIRARRL